MKDYCTGFPDYWYRWGYNLRWERIYIGHLCRDHDISEESKECSSTRFFKGLWSHRVVGTIPIFIVASIACWVKYPFRMMKRI